MTPKRAYKNDKRQAQAAETRNAILKAFAGQLLEPGRSTLSPSEAATTAGVSVRTVHTHFPNYESQITGLAEYYDAELYPGGVDLVTGPDDLPRYYRDIHAKALQNRLSWVLATNPVFTGEIRTKRRRERLDAIRKAVRSIDAPRKKKEDALAMLLSLSGADASWPLHDLYDLPLDRVPDVMANTVRLIIDDLRASGRGRKS